MKKLICTLCTALLLCLHLTGCATVKNKIAYTVYPVGFLIDRIGGSTVIKESIQNDGIIQRATIKDNYEDTLKSSAVFMHIGTLEPYLTVYSNEIKESKIQNMDLSVLNAVYNFRRYTQIVTDGEVSFVEGPYYKGDMFNMIDADEKDLFLWNDPISMLSMAKDIRDWLVSKFPDQASVYEENYYKLETDLINLDAQYQALATSLVKNNQQIRFVSMTASFGTWQKTYGFQVYPVILSKYGVLPNKEQLEVIKERILADGVKYIVYEPNMTPDMIELFNELESSMNLKRVNLSNLSSLTKTEVDDGKDYVSIMYENLSVLTTMKEDISAAADN